MPNSLDFLDSFALTKDDFKLDQEFLIPKFLPKKLITLLYADGGTGKSFLAISITKHLLNTTDTNIVYIDFDNPISVLKSRGIDTLIQNNERLSYLHRSSINISPLELIVMLEKQANGHNYQNHIFIIDSIRDIIDIKNDNKTLMLMNCFKNIREAGGSILLLSHSNKDGRNYEGSVNLRNSIDCMYHIIKRPSKSNVLNFLCEVRKERAGIISHAFSVNADSLELNPLDMNIANMNEYELEFVDNVKKALASGKQNKTDLLKALGKEKTDKTARDTLAKFEGIFYDVSKSANKYLYENK